MTFFLWDSTQDANISTRAALCFSSPKDEKSNILGTTGAQTIRSCFWWGEHFLAQKSKQYGCSVTPEQLLTLASLPVVWCVVYPTSKHTHIVTAGASVSPGIVKNNSRSTSVQPLMCRVNHQLNNMNQMENLYSRYAHCSQTVRSSSVLLGALV